MATKSNRFVFDWWVVQKRILYLIVALFVVAGVAGGAALYVWKYGNPLANVGTGIKMAAGARFISFEGDVRVIRAATRETIVPGTDTELYPGDTVQTQASGRARVSMADGSTLVVRPNSTIIVRDNASADDGKKTNVHVVVDSGQMSVRTEQQPEGTNNVVETPKTRNKIGEQTGASFGVNPEGTEEIRVNLGAVETSNRSWRKNDPARRRVCIGESIRHDLAAAKTFGDAAAFSTARSRESFRGRKWFGKRRFEMAAATVRSRLLLSSGSSNLAVLRCRRQSDRTRPISIN